MRGRVRGSGPRGDRRPAAPPNGGARALLAHEPHRPPAVEGDNDGEEGAGDWLVGGGRQPGPPRTADGVRRDGPPCGGQRLTGSA
ncbi:hypothetical protein [Streptomyces sp. NPDC006012]|uniref:hypothetical protein n=1 Tax=Streptomyces sp. NPDC006012 TaxID=3364739 RepID=UPI0036886EE6